jgi:hypothetical protein
VGKLGGFGDYLLAPQISRRGFAPPQRRAANLNDYVFIDTEDLNCTSDRLRGGRE